MEQKRGPVAAPFLLFRNRCVWVASTVGTSVGSVVVLILDAVVVELEMAAPNTKNDNDDEGGVWVGLDLGTSNSTCAVWDFSFIIIYV